jgi:hypothetical protein
MKTTPAQTHARHKQRGIIVLDTSALLQLLAPYPDGNEPRWLEYLANKGYEIHIPEMVAFEAGHTLRDGTHTNYFFEKPADADKLIYKKAYRFLHKVANDHYPNIQIVPTPGPLIAPSKGAELMRALWDARASESKWKGRQIAVELDGMRGNHLGEIAAGEYIHSIYPEQQIYFLSNNRSAGNEIVHFQQSRDRQVCRLNVTGVIRGLSRHKLLPDVGLDNKLTVEQIGADILAQLKKCGLNDIAEVQPPIDCSYYGERDNNYPFSHSLHGLTRKPVQSGQANGTSSDPVLDAETTGVSRADIFNARYGGDWRMAAARRRNGTHPPDEPKR